MRKARTFTLAAASLSLFLAAAGCASSSTEDTSTTGASSESPLDIGGTTVTLVAFDASSGTMTIASSGSTYDVQYTDATKHVAAQTPVNKYFPTDPIRGLASAWNGMLVKNVTDATAWRSLLSQMASAHAHFALAVDFDGVVTAMRPVP